MIDSPDFHCFCDGVSRNPLIIRTWISHLKCDWFFWISEFGGWLAPAKSDLQIVTGFLKTP